MLKLTKLDQRLVAINPMMVAWLEETPDTVIVMVGGQRIIVREKPNEVIEAFIRFHERVADYIREKKWHDSQRLRELRGGGVELRLKLSSLGEVGRWVLSWGGDAVVIRPTELAESVRRAAQKVLSSARAR